jgi:hypothetical protein
MEWLLTGSVEDVIVVYWPAWKTFLLDCVNNVNDVNLDSSDDVMTAYWPVYEDKEDLLRYAG